MAFTNLGSLPALELTVDDIQIIVIVFFLFQKNFWKNIMYCNKAKDFIRYHLNQNTYFNTQKWRYLSKHALLIMMKHPHELQWHQSPLILNWHLRYNYRLSHKIVDRKIKIFNHCNSVWDGYAIKWQNYFALWQLLLKSWYSNQVLAKHTKHHKFWILEQWLSQILYE